MANYDYKSIKVNRSTYDRLHKKARRAMSKGDDIPISFDDIITALMDALKVPK